MSGRSSAYGEATGEGMTTGARSETSSLGLPSTGGVLPPDVEQTGIGTLPLYE